MEEKSNFFKKRKKQIVITLLALIIVVGVTFAWLSLTLNSTNKNVIVAGNLKLTIMNEDPIIKAGGENGYAIPMADQYGLQTTPYTFTVTNVGKVAASYEITLSNSSSYTEKVPVTDAYGDAITNEYGYVQYTTTQQTIYYDTQRIDDSKIKFNIREGNDTNTNTNYLNSSFGRVLISGTLPPGATKTYQLRLWVAQEAANTDVVDKVFAATLTINAIQYQDSLAKNPHINAVYKYIEDGTGTGAAFTGCLGGAEAGCTDISSQMTKLTKYQPGTVIKYEVSSGVYKYFNVLHDDGDTLTLQHRENTVSNKAWYGTSESYTNVNGPSTTSGYVLYGLEQSTSSWTNVNDQTYSIGDNTTTLGYSGCSSYSNCAVSKYQLSREIKKARMITIQETNNLGCTTSNMSCPTFINNYLSNATSYGGTFSQGNNYYWTMSAHSGNSVSAWVVGYSGRVSSSNTPGTYIGARAVVVINK